MTGATATRLINALQETCKQYEQAGAALQAMDPATTDPTSLVLSAFNVMMLRITVVDLKLDLISVAIGAAPKEPGPRIMVPGR